MEIILGNKILGIKACPYCGGTEVSLSNPFLSIELLNTDFHSNSVPLFVFCETCRARGPIGAASVGQKDDDFINNLVNAKREAVTGWNNVRRE